MKLLIPLSFYGMVLKYRDTCFYVPLLPVQGNWLKYLVNLIYNCSDLFSFKIMRFYYRSFKGTLRGILLF